MLQTATVAAGTLELLRNLQAEPLLRETRLVGGTGLSLLIGHRESEDLDLFSSEPIDGLAVQNMLVDKYSFVPSVITGNTIIGFVGGVKIDVIFHPFPWLTAAIEESDFRIAAMTDIAAMKMHAIINSGKRPKDFVDMAFLSMHFTYNEIKKLLLRRYPSYDPMMADRAVIYFGDIDESLVPEIKMCGYEFDFERIKTCIVKMTDNPDKVYKMAPLKIV